MSVEEIIVLRIAIVFFWSVFLIFGIGQILWRNWRNWFKRGQLTGFFYEWKGTKKAYVWYAVWMSLHVLVNICPFIIYAPDMWDFDLLAICWFLVISTVGTVVLGAIYLIIKHQLRAYYDRKEEREEAEEERKRAEEREARRKAQTEEKPHNDSSAPPDSPDEHDIDIHIVLARFGT